LPCVQIQGPHYLPLEELFPPPCTNYIQGIEGEWRMHGSVPCSNLPFFDWQTYRRGILGREIYWDWANSEETSSRRESHEGDRLLNCEDFRELEIVRLAKDRSARDNDKLVPRCMLVLASSSGMLQRMAAGKVLHETNVPRKRKRDRVCLTAYLNNSYFIHPA